MTLEDKTKLLDAATKYYNGESTGLSDKEYDNLLLNAKLENPEFNIFKEITIGTDRESINHYIPFTTQEFKLQFSSLDEIKSLINNKDNFGWIITPKWDGCSIRAYYKNGLLSDILTRSDEYSGKRKFDSLYNKVPHKVDENVLCIDFEAVCSKEDYEDDTRSNANGLVNSCYKQDEVDKYLQLIPFKVTTKTPMKYLDAMNLVFLDSDYVVIDINKFNYDRRFVEFHGKSYPIDGIVLYDDTIKSHRIYKHYFNENPRTIVTNISWKFTDKLCWVPTVEFNTVIIDGRRVSRATSNGYSRLKYIQAGVGSEVEIILANSTIPQVSNVIKPSTLYLEPTKCPYCGSEIINVNEKLRCSNQFCSNIIDWISYYFINNLHLDTESVKTLDGFKNIIELSSKSFNIDEVLDSLANSIVIERFSRYDLISEKFKANKNELFSGLSSIDLIRDLFTYNQYSIYYTYYKLIDKVITYIKEYYDL